MSSMKTSLVLKASISSKTYRLFVVPANLWALFISSIPKVRLSYKVKKGRGQCFDCPRPFIGQDYSLV